MLYNATAAAIARAIAHTKPIDSSALALHEIIILFYHNSYLKLFIGNG
ncbi:MAG: hypothetical protein BAJALOKI3v1_30037 [Promethearchaeota archaeon]|nr:MAG: hypothetical protein BAJALOKI3v1_30037 [Candidatus Lokiarchaeota archaeon]